MAAGPPPLPHRPKLGASRLAIVARAQQKSLGIATTVAALLLIVRLCLKPDGRYLPAQFDVCILCGNKSSADFILNVLLFVPLGFGLRLAGARRRIAWAVAVLLTITIETLQYFVVTGRDSGLNDLVSNSLGAVVGVALADAIGMLLIPPPATARRLAVGAATVWCAIAAGIQWTLRPALPADIYYEQVAPDLPHYSVFDGSVIDATFAAAPFRTGRLSPDSSAAMRTALLAGHARVEVRILPGAPTGRLAPIASVFGREQQEIFILGRRRDAAVFRLHRRAEDLGFVPPSLTFAHAFPMRDRGSHPMSVVATVLRAVNTIDVASAAGTRRVSFGDGVWQGWRLFLPDDSWYGDYPVLFTVAWVMILCAPMGYWAARAARGIGSARAAIPVVVALIASFAIIPWAAGAPPGPWSAWCAGAIGVVFAWGLERWIDA